MNIETKLAKLTSQQKIYIHVGFTIAIIICLSFFIIWPSIKSINESDSSIAQQRVKMEKKYIEGQEMKKISSLAKKIAIKTEKINKTFLKNGHEVDFITDVENISTNNDVKININLNDIKSAKENYKIMPITISIQGKSNNVVKFLNTIESSPYYININSIEISSNEDYENNSQKEISLNITAETYWK